MIVLYGGSLDKPETLLRRAGWGDRGLEVVAHERAPGNPGKALIRPGLRPSSPPQPCQQRNLIALRSEVWLGLVPVRAQGSAKMGSRPLRPQLGRATFCRQGVTSLFRPGALGAAGGLQSWRVAAGTRPFCAELLAQLRSLYASAAPAISRLSPW